MSGTLDDALEALRREHFYRAMASAQAALESDPQARTDYEAERDAWLDPPLAES